MSGAESLVSDKPSLFSPPKAQAEGEETALWLPKQLEERHLTCRKPIPDSIILKNNNKRAMFKNNNKNLKYHFL